MRISDWSSDVCSSDLIDVSEGREQLGELHHQEPVLIVRLVALWLSFLRFVPAETRNAIEIAAQCFKGVRTQIAGAFTLGKKAVNLHQRQMVADRINLQQYRSEEHKSELKSLMRSSYAVFCLHKKQTIFTNKQTR